MVAWFGEWGYVPVFPRDEATRVVGDSASVIDIVMAKAETAHLIAFKRHRVGLSDHLQLDWTCQEATAERASITDHERLNYKNTNWQAFHETLWDKTTAIRSRTPKTDCQIDSLARVVTEAIQEALQNHTPKLKISIQSKKWWTEELSLALTTAKKARQEAKDYGEEHAEKARQLTNDYHKLIKVTKQEHWQEFLLKLEPQEIWQAAKFCKPGEPSGSLPALKNSAGKWTTSLAGKADALEGGLFPPPPVSTTTIHDFEANPEEKWGDLKEEELQAIIQKINGNKAPGPDVLKATALKEAWKCEAFRPHMSRLFGACVKLGYQPLASPDAVFKLVQDAQLANDNKKGIRTTAMMVDVKGAFDKVHRDTLLKALGSLQVPEVAIRWICSFLSERSTSQVIDGWVLASRPVQVGIPQGSPISPLLFLLHTTPIYRLIRAYGVQVIGYIDDITVYTRGTATGNTAKLTRVLKAIHSWSDVHHMEIDYGDKLGFMLLGRSGKDSTMGLTLPTGDVRHAQPSVKLLGIILDIKMKFGPHLKAMKAKAQGALALTQRLGGNVFGVKGNAVRSVYKACVMSIMEYGIEI